MRNNGIPEEQIIHMANDLVANNSENPFPGMLFNKPDGRMFMLDATLTTPKKRSTRKI
jgi:glycosylphosphatidylinositol transamidase (GPIT) subunit GPI8